MSPWDRLEVWDVLSNSINFWRVLLGSREVGAAPKAKCEGVGRRQTAEAAARSGASSSECPGGGWWMCLTSGPALLHHAMPLPGQMSRCITSGGSLRGLPLLKIMYLSRLSPRLCSLIVEIWQSLQNLTHQLRQACRPGPSLTRNVRGCLSSVSISVLVPIHGIGADIDAVSGPQEA